MNIQKSLFLLLLVLAIASCKDDEPNFDVGFDPFIGSYEVVAQHTTGLHAVYDDMGQFMGMEEELEEVTHTMNFNYGSLDSLLVLGLLNDWAHGMTAAKATISGDTLIIQSENNDVIRNDYIRGKIWLQGDQLQMNYRWDKSDTWSIDATPVYGEVTAVGTRN